MTPLFTQQVEELFGTYMTAEHPDVPFYFDNSETPRDLDVYVVFHILPSEDVLQVNIGMKSKSRNVGLIQADVFGPKDVGRGDTHDIAHAVGKTFKRLSLLVATEGLATFKDPSVVSRGEVRGRHKEQMRVAYRYDFQD